MAASLAPILLREDQGEVVIEWVCSIEAGEGSIYSLDGEQRGMAEVVVEEGSAGGHGHG